MEGGVSKILAYAGPVGNKVFFYIITYFFNKIKPVAPQVSGETSPYDRPLEVAKKLHMVEPTGDTELSGRWRRVDV